VAGAQEKVGPGSSARPRALWPRLLAFGVIVAAVAGAYVYGRFHGADRSSAQAEQGGYAGFEPAQIDLGDQLWAQVVPVALTFVNRGASPITIESAQSSCDCTVIEGGVFRGRRVTPGESLPVEVKLDTQKSPGLKARRIDLTAASGARYSAVIRVNVVGTWSITPDALDFGEVVLDDAEEDPHATVLYESATDNLLDVSTSGAAWTEAQPIPTDHDGIGIRAPYQGATRARAKQHIARHPHRLRGQAKRGCLC
jgi:hypothetical protein